MCGLFIVPLIAAGTTTGPTTETIKEPEEKAEIATTTYDTEVGPIQPKPEPQYSPDGWIDYEGKRQLEERFGVGHPLVAVSRCEAGYAQYEKDGSLRKNPKSSATGQFQILRSMHEANAQRMGFDITTPEGNQDYAEYLYENNGLSDWEESRDCWESLIS